MVISSSWSPEAPGPLFDLHVLLFAALVVPRLKRLPPAELRRRLDIRDPLPPALPRNRAEALAHYIDRLLCAARPLVRPGCLTRGLTLYRFLRRAGADVALHFGLTRAPGGVAGDGHCWLTLSGEPLAEKRDPRPLYLETFRLPGPGAPPPSAGTGR